MIELSIALMSAMTIFGIARVLGPSDRVISARVRSLAPVELPSVTRPSLAARLGARLPGDRPAIALSLQAAKLGIREDVIVGWSWISALVGILLGLFAGPGAIIAVPLLGTFGYKIPSTLLRSRVAANRREIAAALPDAVELLAVCTQAGLNIPLALARVARATPGVLGAELSRVVDEVDLGATRTHALKSLASRCDQDEIHAFVSALDHADRFGSGVASALDALASDMRARRKTQTEETARKAPVKMLFPLVLMILPAFILLTIVPLLLGTFETLGF